MWLIGLCVGGGLVVEGLEKFYLVDEGSEGRDGTGALCTIGELEGEVEAVGATGIHELEGFDKSGEHRVADHMDDGVG